MMTIRVRFPFTDPAGDQGGLAVVRYSDLVRWFQLLCLIGSLVIAEPKTVRWQRWHTPTGNPFARWEPPSDTPKDRYLDLARDYWRVARETLICGQHVHVGVDDGRHTEQWPGPLHH